MSAPAAAIPRPAGLGGRTFMHPLADYLLIGGGLSLLATLALAVMTGSGRQALVYPVLLPYLVLASNSAHFASSTVRLYTRPGALASWPFLTMGFPLTALAVLTLCIAFAGALGPHLQALYQSWAPYHYAAQAYGLAVMYSYRSGCAISAGDKRLLWWSALIPFFHQSIAVPNIGIHWLVPQEWLLRVPFAAGSLESVAPVLAVLAFAAPLAVYLKIWRGGSGPMPAISGLVLLSNCVWWFVLAPLDAFAVATIFHGLQYLVIVLVFHVRERVAQPENRHGPLYHGLWFYGTSLALGYALFQLLPYGYSLAGFGLAESMLLVAAAINLHHFIVDGFIWRLGQRDANRRIVEGGAPAAAPA
jgi:hypothetical protein